MKAPQIWLALLRIIVGAWFLKAVWTKLTVQFAWGVVPYLAVTPRFIGFQPKRVAEFANGNPVDWYKQFLEDTVLPHARLFANLQAYGEVAVGIALLLGFCIGLTALIGLFLMASWGLAGREPGQLAYPWASAVDRSGRIITVDSGNNRLQVFRF